MNAPSGRLRRFTLLEIAIVVAIFGVITLLIFGFSETMVSSSNTVSTRAALSAKTDEVHHAICEELRQAELIYIESELGQDLNGDSDTNDIIRCSTDGVAALSATPALRSTGAREITYRLPVDHDGDGDFLDDEGRVTFGATHPTAGDQLSSNLAADPTRYLANTNYTYRLRFVENPANQYSEAATGVDLNNDGDLTDTFDVGHLEKTIRGNGGGVADQVIQLTADVVLLVDGSVVGDVDGDGNDDPLFLQPNVALVQLTTCLNSRYRGAGTFVRRQTATAQRNYAE